MTEHYATGAVLAVGLLRLKTGHGLAYWIMRSMVHWLAVRLWLRDRAREVWAKRSEYRYCVQSVELGRER